MAISHWENNTQARGGYVIKLKFSPMALNLLTDLLQKRNHLLYIQCSSSLNSLTNFLNL